MEYHKINAIVVYRKKRLMVSDYFDFCPKDSVVYIPVRIPECYLSFKVYWEQRYSLTLID